MRDIAAASGYSLGLTYRYFASKEDLLIAFYERCSAELALEINDLPSGKAAERFTTVMRSMYTSLLPFRLAFGEMAGVLLNPSNSAGVFNDKLAYLRSEGYRHFYAIIAGASDAPPQRNCADLAVLAYAGYLMLLLFWVNDTSDGQSSTYKLLDFVYDLMTRTRLLIRLPLFARSCTTLSSILRPMFGGSSGA